VLVSPAGIKGTYVKSRLVPFGEYIPFRRQLGWLTSISKASPSNMEPGTGAHLLNAVDAAGAPLPIGVLICFESAFPDMSRADADLGAQLIVYQSSTSTFQGTWGPDQHASLGAIRAAETGRPVVQAALTGDTVAFDARGRQLAWLGQEDHGVVTVTVSLPPAGAKTFYDQAGDYVMWSGVAITLLAALVMLLRRRHFLGITTGAAGGRTAEYDADTGDPVRQLAPGASRDRRGRRGRRTSSYAGRHRCRFTAFCRFIRRHPRCARTLSGQWRGPSERPSACPGSARPLPQGLFVLS
jgi:apolipoprotein N-acyltransferase